MIHIDDLPPDVKAWIYKGERGPTLKGTIKYKGESMEKTATELAAAEAGDGEGALGEAGARALGCAEEAVRVECAALRRREGPP